MFFKIITQIIGVIGLGFGIIAFQSNKHKYIVLMKTLSSSFFAVQYVLLGAYTATVLDIVGSVRNLLFLYLVKRGKNMTPYIIFFSVFSAVGCVAVWIAFGWKGPIDILALVAKVISSVAYGIKSTKVVRILSLPSSIIWVIYNLVIFSIAGMISDSLTVVSIVIAMVRFRNKNETQAAAEKKDDAGLDSKSNAEPIGEKATEINAELIQADEALPQGKI